MKKYQVEYGSGESRNGDGGCDYMFAYIQDESNGNLIELYAECEPCVCINENNDSSKIETDETATPDCLKMMIPKQANEKKVDPACPVFFDADTDDFQKAENLQAEVFV